MTFEINKAETCKLILVTNIIKGTLTSLTVSSPLAASSEFSKICSRSLNVGYSPSDVNRFLYSLVSSC